MGFSRSQSIYVALGLDQVWELLTDPEAWLQFDDQLQRFTPETMTGSRLQVGDRVSVVPKAVIRGFVHAATAPAATIVTADPHREIAWRQNQPGGYTQQRWLLSPGEDGGTMLTRHMTVVGPLAAPLSVALAEPLSGDLGAVGARMMQMGAAAPDSSQPLNIIAGGSGYLGSRLATRLQAAGHRVVVLSRTPKAGRPYRQVRWGADDLEPLHAELMDEAGFNIINLVGRRIGPRFTPKEVAVLAASRIEPTETLRSAVDAAIAKGGTLHRWIQGSAVPLWHPDSTQEFTETTSPTADQDAPRGMGQLVADWEASAPDTATIVRTGVVIGQQAQITYGLGAMALTKTQPGVDGYVPWIHEDDWVGLVQHLLTMQQPVPSTVVAVAPQLTLFSEVINALAPGLGLRNFTLPAPLLRIAMQIVGMDPGMLMSSTRASSAVLDELGYTFKYPTIAQAADAVRI